MSVEEAAAVLKRGGVIVFPTETAYGLGADATNTDAVRRIYEIKGRDFKKPLPVLVDSVEMARKYAVLTPLAESLIREFMPGPLTIIANKLPTLPDVVNPEGISFRISSHPLAQQLVSLLGRPVTATSANISGGGELYEIRDVRNVFADVVDYILDAGDLPRVKPSTIVDVRGEPKIVREGALAERVLTFLQSHRV